MRRSHVYFLVDTSKYMIGEPIRKIEEIIRICLEMDRQNSWAIESRLYSIITFGNSEIKEVLAKTEHVDLPGTSFQFACSKERRFIESIDFLMKKHEEDFIKPNNSSKGDYASSLLLFTGGLPESKWSDEQLKFLKTAFQAPLGINSMVNGTYLILFNNEYVKKWYSVYFTESQSKFDNQILDIENQSQIREAYQFLSDRFFMG
ncbi:vWA domain-containing protein [Emticicia fontis]